MVAILLVLVTACAGGEVGAGQAAITGGEPESGYPSVFALAYDGVGGCTGTCITPHVGLTAKHCVEGDPASAFTALFGDSEYAPEQVIQVTALEMAATADIALVAFEEACPAVTPYNQTALEAHVGEPVVMVGRSTASIPPRSRASSPASSPRATIPTAPATVTPAARPS
jgi:hypothetical protein